MKIIIAETPPHEVLWNRFVYAHEDSHFEQLYGWKKIFEDTYGCKTNYLMALDEEKVLGILPLLIVGRSIFGGNYVTSMPGGVCAFTNDIACSLIDRAIRVTREHNAQYLKIRDGNRPWIHDTMITAIEPTFVVASGLNDPKIIWNAVKSNARTPVRRAQDAGLTIEWGIGNFDCFYSVYSTNMRDLGSPATPKLLFQRAINQFPGTIDLLIIKYRDGVIGGMLFFFHRGSLYNPIASSLRAYFNLQPNDLLYWEALKYACAKGFMEFNMGRSERDSGNAKFKMKWTAKPRNSFYQYFLNTAKNIPDTRGGMIYNIGSKIWRRLPLFIADSLGPFVRRSVPDEI